MILAATLRPTVLRLLLALFFSLGVCGPVVAQTIDEPGRGSPVRAAVLDALRPTIGAEMGGAVEFVVTRLRTTRQWAFVQADPQRPGGGAIDLDETVFAGEGDMMDGLTVFALLRLYDGEWRLMTHAVGPTDVVYLDWAGRYSAPAELMDLE